MRTALLLLCALALMTGCQVSVDLGDSPNAGVSVVLASTSTPTPEPSPTPTVTPTRSPDPAVLSGYLLTLADLPPGYTMTQNVDEWPSEWEMALEPSDDPLDPVMASVFFELKDLESTDLFREPLLVHEVLLWFETPKMAQAAYLLMDTYLEEEMDLAYEGTTIEQAELGPFGDESVTYRSVLEDGDFTGVSYVVWARRGPLPPC